MVNVPKLRGKMVEREMNANDLADRIKIDKATFYRKLKQNGETFTVKEADLISKELNLCADEAMSIFFSQYVA